VCGIIHHAKFTSSANTLGRIFRFLPFNSLFVRIKHTSNMATKFCSQFDIVAAPLCKANAVSDDDAHTIVALMSHAGCNA